MEIISVVFIFAVFGSLFCMHYHTDKKLDAWRRETNDTIRQNRIETNAVLMAIQQEIKDFHQQLFIIKCNSENDK